MGSSRSPSGRKLLAGLRVAGWYRLIEDDVRKAACVVDEGRAQARRARSPAEVHEVDQIGEARAFARRSVRCQPERAVRSSCELGEEQKSLRGPAIARRTAGVGHRQEGTRGVLTVSSPAGEKFCQPLPASWVTPTITLAGSSPPAL